MSIQEIINFIKYKQYIHEDEISYSNYFKGDYSEYKRCGTMYMTILKDVFTNYSDITNSSIYISYDNLYFHISYLQDFDNIFWNISISKDIKKIDLPIIKNLY